MKLKLGSITKVSFYLSIILNKLNENNSFHQIHPTTIPLEIVEYKIIYGETVLQDFRRHKGYLNFLVNNFTVSAVIITVTESANYIYLHSFYFLMRL